tara:strand:+ start:1627 stop:3036 length:1410 start_codon:yes stop_codon:yes gene_type:complete
MALAPINPTQLTPPRVAFIDERSGAISREWYRFFLSLLTATQTNQDEAQLDPDTSSLLATYDAMLASATQTSAIASDGMVASLESNLNNLQNAFGVTPPDLGGTVISVAALTLGTTGTDLSSTVANGTTTPVITLNIPTASASNRGALSSTDWSTFNGKQAALVSGTNIKTVGGVSLLGSGDVGTIGVTYGGTGTATAFTAGSVVFAGASGVYSQDNTNLFWDNTNKRLGIGTTAASYKLDVRGDISVSSTASGSAPANGGYFGVSSSGLYMSSTGSTPLSFAIGGTERAWLNTTGNYVVGASNDDNINSGVGVKLRGASTGNGVATVSASSTNAAVGLSMYSTGAAAYRFYVSWDGKINCTSTTIAAISDVRMKENIRDLDYGLDTILALKPRRFDWKAGKGKGTKDDIGFIAQEAELVMPEMVGSWLPGPGDPEDLKSLSAGELIPVFVKAIQELTARVEELERNAK